MHVTFSIDDSNGDVSFLVNDATAVFIDESSTICRASHVEPVNPLLRAVFYTLRAVFGEYGRIGACTRAWACLWRINLSPVNGPILPAEYSNRADAITAEIAWLEHNFL
jgi:hypothetical protein